MQPIHLNDQLFLEAQRRAVAAGFQSVDDFVADVLQHDFDDDVENLDFLFTPDRLAKIDRAAAQIDAGLGLTPEQVESELARQRTEWLDQNRR